MAEDEGTGGAISDTTEVNIPPNLPPDIEELQMELVDLAPALRGAAMNLYEACKKIKNGDELAQVSLILSRKLRELVDNLFAANNAINVKSTEFTLTGARNDDTATGAQNNLYEYLVSKNIIGANATT